MKKLFIIVTVAMLSVVCHAQSDLIASLNSKNFNNYVKLLNTRITKIENGMNALMTKHATTVDLNKSNDQKKVINNMTEMFVPVSKVRIYWRSAKSVKKHGVCSSMMLEDFLKGVVREKMVVLSIDSIGVPIWNEELAKRKDRESQNCEASYWAESKMTPFRVQERNEFAFRKSDVNDVRSVSGNNDLLITRRFLFEKGWHWVPLFGTLVVHCN